MTGTSAPVLYFDNLPLGYNPDSDAKTASAFWQGLTRCLQNDMRRPYRKAEISAVRFTEGLHQDYAGPSFGKITRGLLCLHPGEPPVANIFTNASNVIDAILEARHISPENYVQERTALSEKLLHLALKDDYDKHNDHATQPLLRRNPHAQKNPNAPEFIIFLPKSPECDHPEDQALLAEFLFALADMRAQLSLESEINTKANTGVLWNDSVVLHDRGGDRERDTESKGRSIQIQHITSAMMPPYGQKDAPQAVVQAVGAPCAHIKLPAYTPGTLPPAIEALGPQAQAFFK